MEQRYCPNCLKAMVACFCDQITSFNNQIEIIILQHPSEFSHPLGTAQIAKLSFENLTIFKGEDFSKNELLNTTLLNKDCYLLFPGPNSVQVSKLKVSLENSVLIVLDGTWKKAKKIFYSTPKLQDLKRITLDQNITSEYILRKEPKLGYLSTLEAIVYSLEHLEEKSYSKSIEVLKSIQSFQIKRMGQEKFNKFYINNKK
jgi:DTW domain-containing protein YfiP